MIEKIKINLSSFLAGFVIFSTIFLGYDLFAGTRVLMNKEMAESLDNRLILNLKDGVVVIKMFPKEAPKHVARIKELCRGKFYDGLTFHRVIDGFMVQGGDPVGNGTGGSGKKIPAEFSKLSHKRGIVSMARAMDPNSADSQFFIVTKDSGFLDGQYTVWGEVISGMEYVDKIKKGDQYNNGTVQNPDKIISMRVAIDDEKEKAIKK